MRKYDEVGDIIISELNQINKALLVEREFINNLDITDKEKGKRLLFLFQLDLLPGVNGQILEAKGKRDNKQERCVPAYAKYFSWNFILILNIGMLYYILLFALNQTEYRFIIIIIIFLLLLSLLLLFYYDILLLSLLIITMFTIK